MTHDHNTRPLVADRYIAETMARSCDDIVVLFSLLQQLVRRLFGPRVRP